MWGGGGGTSLDSGSESGGGGHKYIFAPDSEKCVGGTCPLAPPPPLPTPVTYIHTHVHYRNLGTFWEQIDYTHKTST